MVIILFAFVVNGVFGDTEAISVMEGDHVTLNTATKQHHDLMRWYFNDIRIALINGGPSTSCVYDGEGRRFRDRLEVDYETGSLIITNTTTEHAGRYEAELIRINSSGKSESFNRPRKCDSTKINKKNSKSGDIIKSFSLTVSASDSGKNKDEGLTEPQDKDTSSDLSSAVVAGIVVVGVVLLVAAAVVVRRKIDRSIFRNVKEKPTSEKQVSNDETQNERSIMI